MARLLLALMVVGNFPTLQAQTSPPNATMQFKAAEVLSVSPVKVPFFCRAGGTVVLNIATDETGKAEQVNVIHGVSCLTKLALDSVKDWTFSPATLDGDPIESVVPVAITFRPQGLLTDRVAISSPSTPVGAGAEEQMFLPAEVTHGVYPHYPDNSVVSGTVVMEAKLNEEGRMLGVRTLLDVPPLGNVSRSVLDEWRFEAATYDGYPVPSRIVLAFVLQPFVFGGSGRR